MSLPGGGELFSSTLSVNEFALLAQLGPEPVGLVQGTSVHQVGWQYLPPLGRAGQTDMTYGLDVIGRAWDSARLRAFERLREEARLLGADVVLGVELRRGSHDFARRSVDFVVSGTAVRLPPGAAGAAAGSSAPLLSGLSVQDYWKLATGGWTPVGLLAATSAMFISQGSWSRWQQRKSLLESQERWSYTDGFSAARDAVMTAIRRQAQEAGADGVVGLSLDYDIEPRTFRVQIDNISGTETSTGTMLTGSLTPTGAADKRSGVVVTFHATGTAIRRSQALAGGSDLEWQPNLGGST